MEFRFSPEEEALRQEVKRFFEQEVDYLPGWRAYHQRCLGEEEMAFVRGVARKLGERGWLALSWPKEYGGRESPVQAAILTEAAYYYGVIFARDMIGVGMLAPTLIAFGSQEQKHRHLPGIARGEVYWAQGYTEPNAGSDLASVQTRAEDRNDHFLVQGQKIFITNAHNADWIFLLARTDPAATPKHRGISFLLIDMKTPGLTVRPLINLLEGHEFNEVFLDKVRVPRENLVGEKNRGFYIGMALLEFERFGAEACPGSARRVLDRLLGYVADKGSRPQLSPKLAEMVAGLEVARWLYYRNAWLQGKGVPFELGPPIAKLFMSELSGRLYQTGMEILGLYGPLKGDSKYAELEGELAYMYFDIVADTIGSGTSEIQRNIIATRGLGLPRG